jgi:trypsin
MLKLTLLVVLVATCHALPRRRGVVPHIVGGEPAVKNELGYQVSFQYFEDHYCGGTIISANTIVTAAHCIFPGYEYAMTVVAGEHRLREDDGTEQRRSVRQAIVHELYDVNDYPNDIALLILAEPLTLNGAVKALPVAPEGHDAKGSALVSGWGDLSYEGLPPNVLYKVNIPIISDEVCREAYGSDVHDSNICAGVPEGGLDSCQGDSGGPFVADDLGYKYLAGIVSWGEGCAFPNYPGVYTEVAYFAEWISKNME